MATDRSPRISVNKLGEYLVQPDSARRRKIVYDQKHPSKHVVPQYQGAKDAITEALTKDGLSPVNFLGHATRLASDSSGTPKAVSNRQNDAAAIEAFVSLLPELPIGATFSMGPTQPPHLSVQQVSVSVRPEILIYMERAGVPAVGAIKLHFPKAEERALGAKGSEFVAVMLHQWLTLHGPKNRRIVPQLCLSIDVFRKTVHCAPTAQQRRMERIEAACEEIAARWPQL